MEREIGFTASMRQHDFETSPKIINRKLSAFHRYSQCRAAKDLRLGCLLGSSVLPWRLCFLAAAAAISESTTVDYVQNVPSPICVKWLHIRRRLESLDDIDDADDSVCLLI